MLCNKCGKNNPIGAEKCSYCKEPMPQTTGCNGFADILSFGTSSPQEVESSQIQASVSAPMMSASSRSVIDRAADEPWYAELLTKKGIIFISAIAACLILMITLICVITFGSEDAESDIVNKENKTEHTNPEKKDSGPNDFDYKICVLAFDEASGFPKPDFSDPHPSPAKIKLTKSNGEVVNIYDAESLFLIKNSVISPKMLENTAPKTSVIETDFIETKRIVFDAMEKDFPMKLYYNDDKNPSGELELKNGTLVWKSVKGDNALDDEGPDDNALDDEGPDDEGPDDEGPDAKGPDDKVPNNKDGNNKLPPINKIVPHKDEDQ